MYDEALLNSVLAITEKRKRKKRPKQIVTSQIVADDIGGGKVKTVRVGFLEE